jgi:ribonuclease HII
LTARQRERAFLEISDKSVYGIGIISETVIDQLNILVATRLAMENALSDLIEKLRPLEDRRVHILVDGNVKLDIDWPFTNIIGGDAKSKSIASASILAKVIRDRIMSLYDRVYPQYGFSQHKGYPTEKHRVLLKRLGPSLIHRKSFSCV